jgi:hypothetical protein
MTAVGVWLGVIGLCDLVRAGRDATPWRRRLLLIAVGALLLVAATVALAPPWWVLVMWLVALLLWVQGSAAALVGHRTDARVVAFLGVGLGVVGSLLAGGEVGRASWTVPGPLGDLDPELLLVAGGVLLAQLATTNVLVRLVLDAVGVPASDNEKTLKGGRLLGPMERLLVVGLGLAGELTAAGIVVAAKGLLRFPELQRGARSGPTDMTEYFLIGSFASWLLALGGVVLVGLA